MPTDLRALRERDREVTENASHLAHHLLQAAGSKFSLHKKIDCPTMMTVDPFFFPAVIHLHLFLRRHNAALAAFTMITGSYPEGG